MEQIRIHGRGGQGSVTMAYMLSEAAFETGKYGQGFPSYGVERLGAPIQAYVRIDDTKINDRSQIYEPDYVIVQDATLIDLVDVTEGLKEDGTILVNTSENPDDLNLETNCNVETVDATEIALDILGKPIMNTALLGAFAKITGLVEKECVADTIRGTFDDEIAEKNVKAMKKAYDVI